MRIFFYLGKINYLRILGPVIEAGLQRGHDVCCIYEERAFIKQFIKGDGVGSPWESFSKQLRLLPYRDRAHLVNIIRNELQGGAVCSIAALPPGIQSELDQTSSRFFYIQYVSEVIVPFFPDRNPEDFNPVAWLGMSEYWKWFVSHIFSEGRVEPNRDITKFAIDSFVEVGAPEFDVLSTIDAKKVRANMGISPEKKVVLLAAFPYKSNPRTLAHRQYTGGGVLQRALQGLRDFLLRVERSEPVDDRGFCTRLREFCDENDAVLIVKSRRKDPVPRYLRRMADYCVYDPSHYPATILELLAISDLAISFRSSTVFEAVRSKVPHISLDIEDDDLLKQIPLIKERWNMEPDASPYNFPGATRLLSIAACMKELANKDFSDVAQCDRAAQDAYIKKFLGKDDCGSSERAILAIEKICA
jgi:hypothetical protein